MMGYVAPAAPISSSWQDHKNRQPPSSEPGTDYATVYGTVVGAPGPGTVVDRKTSNSGGMGRYVTIALDDGRTTRAIHLSAVWLSVGQRVDRGTGLGLSGASGNGSDWYYGPHVHMTLWPGGAWAAPTIDFALYVGADDPEPEPEPEPDEEELIVRYTLVTRDDMPVFNLIGPDPNDARRQIIQPITTDAQRRAAEKIVAGLNGEDTPAVSLSGEEWDSGAFALFQSNRGGVAQ
jgi:murein DD-endopeptidase MepM/ murein hydrolase activator NlpD